MNVNILGQHFEQAVRYVRHAPDTIAEPSLRAVVRSPKKAHSVLSVRHQSGLVSLMKRS